MPSLTGPLADDTWDAGELAALVTLDNLPFAGFFPIVTPVDVSLALGLGDMYLGRTISLGGERSGRYLVIGRTVDLGEERSGRYLGVGRTVSLQPGRGVRYL